MTKTIRGRKTEVALVAAALLVVIFAACRRVPDYVIQPEAMAELMADVRTADAVINMHASQYKSDAEKLALKNAVLERHGVTQEQFDTSLIWYGRNIGQYQEVTKQTINILEKRLKDVSILAAGENVISVSGDSVDIWDDSKFYIINHRSPTHYIAFAYESDPNWERGDVYTLRSRLINQAQYGQWNLTAIYDDGTIETITSTISLDNPARQEITLVTDSTRTATRISGWINVEPLVSHPVIVDSLGLMRRRSSPDLARTRKYNQKRIIPRKDEANDSISPSEEEPRLVASKELSEGNREIPGTIRRRQQPAERAGDSDD